MQKNKQRSQSWSHFGVYAFKLQSYPPKITVREIAFLVWCYDITISPNDATWCLEDYEARGKIYWFTYRRQSPSVLILSQWNSKAIIERAQIKAEIFLDLNGFKTHSLSLTLALSSEIFAGYRKIPSRRFFKSTLLVLLDISRAKIVHKNLTANGILRSNQNPIRSFIIQKWQLTQGHSPWRSVQIISLNYDKVKANFSSAMKEGLLLWTRLFFLPWPV